MTHPEERRPIRRALLSVYDKDGLPELVRALAANGVRIVSTGTTAAAVEALGVAGAAGRGTDRLPGVASTAGSRRCTRPCTRACWPTCGRTGTGPSWPSWASSRSTCW